MSEIIRKTKSVCPVCLKAVPARLVREADGVFMEKSCPEHGPFRVIVWRDKISFEKWREGAAELRGEEGSRCPAGCLGCAEHESGTCCALLEVTRRCNLKCTYCFAEGALPEPDMAEFKRAVDIMTRSSKPLIQLSGGEPTLRDDLPELIAYIKARGCKYVQLNSNGVRLAEDGAYVKALAEAGLSFVFLQFDGVDDEVYIKLRGKPLLETKKKAIELCGRHGLGVTLVPTVVRGVNENQLGDILRFGAALSPVVRGVHFQPVSYFGRYPGSAEDSALRYTLDELIAALGMQAGIAEKSIAPSHCDHPSCGFHSSFIVMKNGGFLPMTARTAPSRVSAEKNREYIGSRWLRSAAAEKAEAKSDCCCDSMSMDELLLKSRVKGFTVTAMAFQDAMNLDIERLRKCSLHVYDSGALIPFCARYLTPIKG